MRLLTIKNFAKIWRGDSFIQVVSDLTEKPLI